MITIDSVLSKKNLREAFEHLSTKGNGAGIDQIPLTDLKDYWSINGERICAEIRNHTYEPGAVIQFEIVGSNGKRRTISKLNTIDRFVTRLIAQKLYLFYEKQFLENSFAYQNNKGTLQAANKVVEYISGGFGSVVEMDIESFFDSIPHDKLMNVLRAGTTDKAVLNLIEKYLCCSIVSDGVSVQKERGLLQGSPLSPVLSNVYLLEFDKFLESRQYKWVRFSDNIYIYVENIQEGHEIIDEINQLLVGEFGLCLNMRKSGVYDALARRFLGYDIKKTGRHFEAVRHVYQRQGIYHEWHPGIAQRVDHEYHILQHIAGWYS